MNRARSTAAALVAACLLGAGCSSDPNLGYSTEGLYPDDVATVAVPIPTRDARVFRRELETRLAEALVKRIELDTPYKVTDKSRADTILESRLVWVNQRVLGVNPNVGEPREIELQMSVSFTWTDLRTGEIRARRTNLVAAGVYSPADPLNEDFFEGSASAIDLMARRVVAALQKPW